MEEFDNQSEALITAAKNELARRGMPFSEKNFIRYVKSGNANAVQLYLRAGISPNARLDTESALAASANHGHRQITELLLNAGANPVSLLDGLKISKSSRDVWDRLSSLTGVFTFLSSLFIAAIGWHFTSSYNERQLALTSSQVRQEQANKQYQNRLLEMQTVEKMIPHLIKDEPSKQAAVIAISALASPEVAARVAETYGGQGSINALAQLARTDSANSSAPAITALTNIASRESESYKPAHEALGSVLEGRDRAIVKLLENEVAICNGFVIGGKQGWVVIPRYCIDRTKSTKSLMSIQFGDGKKAQVTSRRNSPEGLLVFLKLDAESPTFLHLSRKQLPVGSAVSHISYHLNSLNTNDRSLLSIVLGVVVESGKMSFLDVVSRDKDISAYGLKVKLNINNQDYLLGTGGGPLLDDEGNVACMTFMRDAKGNEQCVSAEVISTALSSLKAE
ncbi:hypothetical protein [Nitrosomonas sp.]|uniref:hypothetical protein n=1 Tax=Nitrosomonas sp. TaxID=42353 RepID=UPI0025D2064E|nr:hypothetical protein [Nitrosomonas sp.]MBY0483846.1 hypothetical protein [Nitrosomonas sp.]